MSHQPVFFPVSSPDIGELELKYVSDAVRSGWVSSIGEYVDRFEKGFAKYCAVDHGVAMSNGTDALFIALKALGIGPGDEVVVPSLTFVAVPAVVVHLGATPVIVDSHPEYWCMDPAAVERAITPKTRAMIVVHVYGHPADMDPLLDLARLRGIKVVEDCAEAHGAKYKGRVVGSIGEVGCFSFYGNKVITTGEGGMAVTNDAELAARMRFLKDHAMDPKRRYFHPEAGYNCRLTNIQAAMGCAQLERIGELLEKRARILEWYRQGLAEVAGISLNPRMPWAEPVNWMVCALLDDELAPRRDEILAGIRERGVDTRPFFVPAERMPPYAGFRVVGATADDTPVCARLSAAGFNLPSSASLELNEVEAISNQIATLIGQA
jgi:perosamine synthetase